MHERRYLHKSNDVTLRDYDYGIIVLWNSEEVGCMLGKFSNECLSIPMRESLIKSQKKSIR